MKIVIILVALLSASSVHGQSCTGVMVGNIPNQNHNVSGVLYIENTQTYCIENFYYDGAGPDAFLYLYYVGDATFIKGGGVTTPVPGQDRIQFEVGRRYTGDVFRFNVPEGHVTCDYGGWGIWCRYASQLFTLVFNLQVYFSPDVVANTIQCTPSPGRAFLGQLTEATNQISGDLFAVSDKVFSIRDFSYDGLAGNNVMFYGIPVGVSPSPGSGTVIGTVDSNAVTDVTTLITISDDLDAFTCDFGAFAIVNMDTSEFLAITTINTDTAFTNNEVHADHDRSLVQCDRPTTRPGVLVGQLPRDGQGIEGTFYVQDNKTFYVQLFSYSAGSIDAYNYYYRLGQQVDNSGQGNRIDFSSSEGPFPNGILNSFKKITPFIVNLNYATDETSVNTCDIAWYTIYSQSEQSHFTRIEIPQDIFTSDSSDAGIALKTKVLCSASHGVATLPSLLTLATAGIISMLVMVINV